MDTVEVHDLEIRATLGRDPWEQRKIQPILVTVKIQTSLTNAGISDQVSDSVHYGLVAKAITNFVESQNLDGIEILAEHLACLILTFDIEKIFGVFVSIKKPNTLHNAKSVEMNVYRCYKDIHFLAKLCRDEFIKTGLSIPDLSQYDSIKDNCEFLNSPDNFQLSIADAGELYGEDLLLVNDLQISALLGANVYERHVRQNILVNITLHINKDAKNLEDPDAVSLYPSQLKQYRKLVRNVVQYVELGTGYLTIEALATAIARVCIIDFGLEKVSILIKKPCVLMFASCSAVKITRTRAQLLKELNFSYSPDSNISSLPTSKSDNLKHVAYIAVGTNLGDRLDNIHKSIRMINQSSSCKVVDTGFLYQSAPMYFEDQPIFLNSALKVKTDLEPHSLLKELKNIESAIGRDFSTIRNGPRVIDLDILFYDSIVIDTPDLVIPHLRIHERHFQLQPVIDMDPDVIHTRLNSSVDTLSRELIRIKGVPNDLIQVMPLSNKEINGEVTLVPISPAQKNTLVMGIVNTTHDSFSDGGKFLKPTDAIEHAMSLFKEGAEILDIGGQSTKVGAEGVNPDEEISRIVPVIKGIRDRTMEDSVKPIISVDTFVAEVAKEALNSGADIINDVSGGDLDPEMFKLAADYGNPIVIMHMRGTPKTMANLTDYKVTLKNENDEHLAVIDDVILTIRYELSKKVKSALDQGIPRFNIILDPGIGFAKTFAQNFEILKRLPELTSEQLYSMSNSSSLLDLNSKLSTSFNKSTKNKPAIPQFHEQLFVPLLGFPVLVGSSRKGFIGDVTGKKQADLRVFGTAATVTSAIQGHACIVRVHDVGQMVDVVKVSDRIYRD
ncbi:Folic acid synthesis protein fol1 [Smittium mucronatum]|uniref:Folic acid synthesis protein fol1 n=1 Tax=Smittium mucronatum TaxID=133383 RepID=A0A1R0GUF1_9FUNG|nr:Folic acid synthesis protein fol1 [Smittium mucronatum]